MAMWQTGCIHLSGLQNSQPKQAERKKMFFHPCSLIRFATERPGWEYAEIAGRENSLGQQRGKEGHMELQAQTQKDSEGLLLQGLP